VTAVAAAVLAAGRGERLGGDVAKPLVSWRGRPLVDWALDAAVSAGLHPVLLVVGHRRREVEAASRPGVAVVPAVAWRRGISHSLRAALRALDGWRQVGAVCVGLADQPLIGPDAYRRLAAAYDAGASFAVATYGGQRANPVLLGRDLWPDALRLRGDEGARVLMRSRDVVEVPCDGTGDPRDVDTEADLRALEEER
jgi:molybdenum cofactor cytidylyltransferase/nicotine blue oxidoreductase